MERLEAGLEHARLSSDVKSRLARLAVDLQNASGVRILSASAGKCHTRQERWERQGPVEPLKGESPWGAVRCSSTLQTEQQGLEVSLKATCSPG